MTAWKDGERGREFGLAFFLIGGALLGTLFCNAVSGELQAALLHVRQELLAASAQRAGTSEFFWAIFFRRFSALLLGALFTITPIAYALLGTALGYLGFGLAVMVSTAAMEAGFWGIFRFLLLIFPQGFCYIPALYLLTWRLPAEKKGLSPAQTAALAALTGAGSLLEALVNPYLTAFL